MVWMVRRSARVSARVILGLTFVLGIVSSAAAQPLASAGGSGVIEGRVVDGGTGNPLPGAQVIVTGSSSETSTDRDGRFMLAAVPGGDRTVVVSYLGRQDATVEIKVTPGATHRIEVQMKMVAFEETVSVAAQLIRRRAGARAEPAEDRAEHHQRRLGRSDRRLSRSQRRRNHSADSRASQSPRIRARDDYVIVRGTEPRLNSMMIDGQRIPVTGSADPAGRASTSCPSELLQSIEVSKALTPDMDADSIGGSVNLVMKQAPEKFRVFGTHRRRLQRAAATPGIRTTTASPPAGVSTMARTA